MPNWKDAFLQWVKTSKSLIEKDTELQEENENVLSGGEVKSWLYQQIAESESNYANEMAKGNVKTYTLTELKAEFS